MQALTGTFAAFGMHVRVRAMGFPVGSLRMANHPMLGILSFFLQDGGAELLAFLRSASISSLST